MNKNKKLRFAFYVSGSASRLVKIIEQYPEIMRSIYIVVNDEAPNQNLSNLLIKKNIKYLEFNYVEKGLKGKNKNIYISNLLLEKFNEHEIDYSFCFGSKILTGELLKVYKNKIINFHPSILPMFPGVKSIDQALNANAFLLGNTVHFVDEGIDTGPIIMQSTIHRNFFIVYEDVLDLQLPMLYQVFCWLNEHRIDVKDNKVTVEKANYGQLSFYPQLEITLNSKL